MGETVRGSDSAGRAYDLAPFGATGFVGELTARYLAAHAPADCRWAIAGRTPAKLEKLRERLVAVNPLCATLPLLHADASDPPRCANSPRAQGSWPRPSAPTSSTARDSSPPARTRARIVHACGFDSVPHDLGAYFTVKQLPEGVPLRVDGFVRSNAMFSGAPSPPRSPRWGAGGRRCRPRRSGGCPDRGWWGGGRRVFTEVSGGDPGYDETAKMPAESVLCLAFDELPATSGQVTTAVAMGDALLERLVAAGLGFRVADVREAAGVTGR